jgi:hypothetical protein
MHTAVRITGLAACCQRLAPIRAGHHLG